METPPPNSPLVNWQDNSGTPGHDATPIPVHAIEQSPGGTSRFRRPPRERLAPDTPDVDDAAVAEAFRELQLGRRPSMQSLHNAIRDMATLSNQRTNSSDSGGNVDDSNDNDDSNDTVLSDDAVRTAQSKLLKRRGSLLSHPFGSVERFIREG